MGIRRGLVGVIVVTVMVAMPEGGSSANAEELQAIGLNSGRPGTLFPDGTVTITHGREQYETTERRNRRRNRVHHVEVKRKRLSLARVASDLDMTEAEASRIVSSGRCAEWPRKTVTVGYNFLDVKLFDFWRSVYWCALDGRFYNVNVNRGANIPNSWWNWWEFHGIAGREDNAGRCCGGSVRWKYDKIWGLFKNCLTLCYSDARVYLWQKIYSDRSYKSGGGPKGGAF
jgi:hypothetical protein